MTKSRIAAEMPNERRDPIVGKARDQSRVSLMEHIGHRFGDLGRTSSLGVDHDPKSRGDEVEHACGRSIYLEIFENIASLETCAG
jgi:hypothetical protein